MICDVCNAKIKDGDGARISPERFRTLLNRGWGVHETSITLMAADAGVSREQARAMLKAQYLQSKTDWMLCKNCINEVNQHGAAKPATPPLPPPQHGPITKMLGIAISDHDSGRITHDHLISIFQAAIDNGDILLEANQTYVVTAVYPLLVAGVLRPSAHTQRFESQMNAQAAADITELRKTKAATAQIKSAFEQKSASQSNDKTPRVRQQTPDVQPPQPPLNEQNRLLRSAYDDIDLDSLKRQFSGAEFRTLIQEHLRKFGKTLDDMLSVLASTLTDEEMSVTKPLINEFIKWGEGPLPFRLDCGDVFAEFCQSLEKRFGDHGIRVEPGIIFAAFQLLITTFAFMAYKDRDIRKLMRIKKGIFS